MVKSYVIILVPFLLIVLQNDLGTALVFTSFVLVFYREGLSGNVLIVAIVAFSLSLASLLMTAWQVSIIATSIIIIIFIISSNRIRSIKISSILALFANGIIFSVDYVVSYILAPTSDRKDFSTIREVRSTTWSGVQFNSIKNCYWFWGILWERIFRGNTNTI